MSPKPSPSPSPSRKESATLAGEVYEKFVLQVYQQLLQQDSVKTVDARHNILLKGRSGRSYQTDVYWEFDLAGVRYRTCVECKEVTRRISGETVGAFADKLNDIGGMTGIFVTTAGYQRAAKLRAKDAKIRLLVLHPILKEIHATLNVKTPIISGETLQFDLQRVRALRVATGLESFQFSFNSTADQFHLVTGDGTPAGTLADVMQAEPTTEGRHEISLDSFCVPSEIGPLPLMGLTYDVKFSTYSTEIIARSDDTAMAIIEDVLANTSEYVHEDGRRERAPAAAQRKSKPSGAPHA